MNSRGVIGKAGMISTGTGTIAAGNDTLVLNTGITDQRFTPVVIATPVINTNMFLQTEVEFDGSQWVFRVSRSIGSNTEQMNFYWKVIAQDVVARVNPAVTPATEN